MSYLDSVDFWNKWASVPLDLAIVLVLGEDPEDFQGYDSQDFTFLKALALNHAKEVCTDFKAPNNSNTWLDDPVVYLDKFGDLAEKMGWSLRDEYPRTKLKSSKQAKPISETERNTMLKIILSMAIDSYGYDPAATKNTATGGNKGSIKAAIDKQGLSVDEDTIRKYLTEAKKLLYPQTQ